MRTITIRRPQHGSLQLASFIEDVISEINNQGLSRAESRSYHGRPVWIRVPEYEYRGKTYRASAYRTCLGRLMWIRKSNFQFNDKRYELTAKITRGRQGFHITFTEEP